jgi:hypothetical protein
MKTLNALAPFALIACLAVPAAPSTGSGQGAQTTTTTTTPAAADVLGTWNATVTTQQGQAIPVQLKLRKDADKIFGTISSDMGEAPVQAEVKGKALTVSFTFQGQNGPMAIEMAGTVDGDAVKGTMAIGGQAGGEWTGTREKAPPASSTSSAASTAATASIPSLTGTWNVTVELPNMTASPTVVLKQDGEKLTGDYVSAQYGKFPLTGTIKGAEVAFSFAMNVDGNALNVTYAGTVNKDGTLKGSANYGDMMSGTFSASRKK